jgi:hypothetical protein
VRRQEAWDTVAVPLGAIRVELKAGTSSAETAPGTVIFDKLKVSRGGTDQTVLLWEDFAGTSLDMATWAIAVQSGHQDANIPVVQEQSRLTIGPLLQGTSGSHYNGVLSQTAFDLTAAAVSVEAVTTPSDLTTADMMFTLTVDNPHHYRIYLEQGFLRFERKTQALGKEGVGPVLAFDPDLHAFWRIRHSVTSDEFVFETAARVNGSPGSWVEHARSPRAFAITGVKVELKAGTWQAEATAPGLASFDSVKVVR